MASDCSSGSSFLLGGHLWIVIAELPSSPDQVLIASLTSKKDIGSDTTVILHQGDHDFIKHDTVINYIDSRIFNKDDLKNRILARDFEADKPFKVNILKIIQQGVLDSPHTPEDKKDFYRKCIQKKTK